jgi:hypothetical protein
MAQARFVPRNARAAGGESGRKNNRLEGEGMDTLQDRGHKEQQRLRLEADLAASIDTLFRRCPSLYGFSVQEASKVTRERAVDHLEGDLYLADVACHPLLDEERCAELCEVVSHTLLELVEERPEMAELLPGRTFARTLH